MTPVPGAPRWLAGYQSGTAGLIRPAPLREELLKTRQPLRDKLICIKNDRGSPECGFSVVCHLFKRAILVSELVQPICIGRKKAFGVE